MRRVVLDAPAFLAWFPPNGTSPLRAEYEAGTLEVHVPRIFPLHVVETARRSRDVPAEALRRLADEVDRLGFEVHDAPTAESVAWLARGADATRAAYAALASSLELQLISDDDEMLRVAASVARRDGTR